MRNYRLFCLDVTNRITKRDNFEAADDQAAIAYSLKTHPNTDCELWELGRKVARIPVNGTPILIEPGEIAAKAGCGSEKLQRAE